MLSEALKCNCSLVELILRSDERKKSKKMRKKRFFFRTEASIGDEGAKRINESLEQNTSLTVLDLDGEEQS